MHVSRPTGCGRKIYHYEIVNFGNTLNIFLKCFQYFICVLSRYLCLCDRDAREMKNALVSTEYGSHDSQNTNHTFATKLPAGYQLKWA